MSSLSIRSFTLFREEQPVRDALVLFTLTLLLHFLGAMLRLVQELSFFWPLNAVMAGIFARYVWLNRSYFYAVCFLVKNIVMWSITGSFYDHILFTAHALA